MARWDWGLGRLPEAPGGSLGEAFYKSRVAGQEQ